MNHRAALRMNWPSALGALALCALAWLVAGCATAHGRARQGASTRPAPSSFGPVRVQITEGGARRIAALDLDEYVVGCVTSEISVAGLSQAAAQRVLELQALLCRTNAVVNRGRHASDGFDLCSDVHCQLYRPPASNPGTRLARAAVAATRGRVVAHAGRPIQAIFHADCGGHTSAAATVWGGAEPYLSARVDGYCDRRRNPSWHLFLELDRLDHALRKSHATRVPGRLRDLRVVQRDEAGRASWIELVGDRRLSVRGSAFRWAVLQAFGSRSLKSTRFSVQRQGAGFLFEGDGNGHGVGLCQSGALARARAGHRPEDILRFYYPGARIKS